MELELIEHLFDMRPEDAQLFRRTMKRIRTILVWMIAAGLLWGSFTWIDPGTVGVPVVFGYLGGRSWYPGLHPKFPLITTVNTMSTRLEKHAVKADGSSKDLQKVTEEVTVPYSLNPQYAPIVFAQFGFEEKFVGTIIDPGVTESVKAISAKFTAEQLVNMRETVKDATETQIVSYIQAALREKSLPIDAILIGNAAITHFDFSKEFNDSIEQKVKSDQDAQRAENVKRQTITNAEAERDSTKAKADGVAYKIQQESIAEAQAIQRRGDALRSNQNLVQLNAVERWDGKLPNYIGGSTPIPFITVGK